MTVLLLQNSVFFGFAFLLIDKYASPKFPDRLTAFVDALGESSRHRIWQQEARN